MATKIEPPPLTTKPSKVTLHLAGSHSGLPTAEQIAIMSERLTGRKPTEKELAEVRKILAAPEATSKTPGKG